MTVIIISSREKVWRAKNPKSSEEKKNKQKYSVFSLSRGVFIGVTDFILEFYQGSYRRNCFALIIFLPPKLLFLMYIRDLKIHDDKYPIHNWSEYLNDCNFLIPIIIIVFCWR